MAPGDRVVVPFDLSCGTCWMSARAAGQANVHRWSSDILELLMEPEDHLGVESVATHHLAPDDAPAANRDFRDKRDGMVKVLFRP